MIERKLPRPNGRESLERGWEKLWCYAKAWAISSLFHPGYNVWLPYVNVLSTAWVELDFRPAIGLCHIRPQSVNRFDCVLQTRTHVWCSKPSWLHIVLQSNCANILTADVPCDHEVIFATTTRSFCKQQTSSIQNPEIQLIFNILCIQLLMLQPHFQILSLCRQLFQEDVRRLVFQIFLTTPYFG